MGASSKGQDGRFSIFQCAFNSRRPYQSFGLPAKVCFRVVQRQDGVLIQRSWWFDSTLGNHAGLVVWGRHFSNKEEQQGSIPWPGTRFGSLA
jgi:hypothetical protein